jgi:hypothetical protein
MCAIIRRFNTFSAFLTRSCLWVHHSLFCEEQIVMMLKVPERVGLETNVKTERELSAQVGMSEIMFNYSFMTHGVCHFKIGKFEFQL